MIRRWPLALGMLALIGACGTDDTSRGTGPEVPDFVLGGVEDEGGSLDGGGIVTSPDDAGTTPGADASPTADAWGTEDASTAADVVIPDSTDAGSPDVPGRICEPNSTRCDGQVLLTCSGDGTAVGRTRCAARDAICEETPEGAQCTPQVCEPGTWSCVSDSVSALCDEVGAGYETEAPCDDGCDPATGQCAGAAPECALDFTPISPGEYLLDLCAAGGDHNHTEQADCGTRGARSGRDELFGFTLVEPTEVYVDLRDEDDEAAIDTILYLRSACDDADTQIACSDDIPCDESDVEFGDCSRERQVRQSRILTRLDAGSYYIVADHLEYRGFGCGQVRLLLDY